MPNCSFKVKILNLNNGNASNSLYNSFLLSSYTSSAINANNFSISSLPTVIPDKTASVFLANNLCFRRNYKNYFTWKNDRSSSRRSCFYFSKSISSVYRSRNSTLSFFSFSNNSSRMDHKLSKAFDGD